MFQVATTLCAWLSSAVTCCVEGVPREPTPSVLCARNLKVCDQLPHCVGSRSCTFPWFSPQFLSESPIDVRCSTSACVVDGCVRAGHNIWCAFPCGCFYGTCKPNWKYAKEKKKNEGDNVHTLVGHSYIFVQSIVSRQWVCGFDFGAPSETFCFPLIVEWLYCSFLFIVEWLYCRCLQNIVFVVEATYCRCSNCSNKWEDVATERLKICRYIPFDLICSYVRSSSLCVFVCVNVTSVRIVLSSHPIPHPLFILATFCAL